MSYEGGVMPSDVVQDATAQGGNACLCAKGLWAPGGPCAGPGR